MFDLKYISDRPAFYCVIAKLTAPIAVQRALFFMSQMDVQEYLCCKTQEVESSNYLQGYFSKIEQFILEQYKDDIFRRKNAIILNEFLEDFVKQNMAMVKTDVWLFKCNNFIKYTSEGVIK